MKIDERRLTLLNNKIRTIPHISKLKKLSRDYNVDIYLVGGFLRDIFLKAGAKEDFDFALSRSTDKLARAFSKITKGRLVILDKALRNVRVVLKRGKKIYNYDFSKFRAKNIAGDLQKRDFTINTLAVKINTFPNVEVIDYLEAKKDIEKRILRCASLSSFIDDPLRIMRAFSLASIYNLRIEEETKELVKKYSSHLSDVAGERVAEELFKILSVAGSFRTLGLMDNLSILEKVFPEIRPMRNLGQGEYHHLDVWNHSLEALRCFEALTNRKFNRDLRLLSYLGQDVAQKRNRAQLIKFACLFHDIGKPKARRKKKKRTLFYSHEKIGQDLIEIICRRLRLSFREEEFIKRLIYFHLRPGYLADIKRPTQRAVYRYFRDTKEEAVGILLLSLADWRATRGPLTNSQRRSKHEKVLFSLIDEYFNKKSRKPVKRLVNGYDVMKRFKIGPSPVIGRILRKIEEAQALGQIKTRLKALEYASKIYSKS